MGCLETLISQCVACCVCQHCHVVLLLLHCCPAFLALLQYCDCSVNLPLHLVSKSLWAILLSGLDPFVLTSLEAECSLRRTQNCSG